MELSRDHHFQVFLAWLFCSASERDCYVCICPNEPSQRGKATLFGEVSNQSRGESGVEELSFSFMQLLKGLVFVDHGAAGSLYSYWEEASQAFVLWLKEDRIGNKYTSR